MRSFYQLMALGFLTTLAFAENITEWKPLAHPAKLIRSITSFTEPSAFVDVKAEYDGRLLKWQVQEGVILSAKSPKVLLVKQDDKLAKLSLQREEASLKSQRQVLKTHVAEHALLKRELAFRKLEMDRISGLAKEGKVPKANFDKAVFEFDRTALSVKQSEEEIALQKQTIVEQKVTVARAAETLSRYQIYAGQGWVLNERVLEEGAWVAAGQTVARLADLRQYSIYVRLNDKEFRSFKNLDPKKINLKTVLGNKVVVAKLHRVDQNFDPVSRKRLIELRVDNSKELKLDSGTELKLKMDMPYPQPVVKLPVDFTYKKFERLHVKTTEGIEIALNPLRKHDGYYYVNTSVFEEATVLVKP